MSRAPSPAGLRPSGLAELEERAPERGRVVPARRRSRRRPRPCSPCAPRCSARRRASASRKWKLLELARASRASPPASARHRRTPCGPWSAMSAVSSLRSSNSQWCSAALRKCAGHLLAVRRVADDEPAVLARAVDDEVVEDGALLVAGAGVERLAVGEAARVVRDEVVDDLARRTRRASRARPCARRRRGPRRVRTAGARRRCPCTGRASPSRRTARSARRGRRARRRGASGAGRRGSRRSTRDANLACFAGEVDGWRRARRRLRAEPRRQCRWDRRAGAVGLETGRPPALASVSPRAGFHEGEVRPTWSSVCPRATGPRLPSSTSGLASHRRPARTPS